MKTTLVITLALIPFLLIAPAVTADQAQEIMRTRIDTIHETGGLTVGEDPIAAVRLIPILYEGRDFLLLWNRQGIIDGLNAPFELRTPAKLPASLG